MMSMQCLLLTEIMMTMYCVINWDYDDHALSVIDWDYDAMSVVDCDYDVIAVPVVDWDYDDHALCYWLRLWWPCSASVCCWLSSKVRECKKRYEGCLLFMLRKTNISLLSFLTEELICQHISRDGSYKREIHNRLQNSHFCKSKEELSIIWSSHWILNYIQSVDYCCQPLCCR